MHVLAELGEKCFKDYECVAENSRCIDVCSCKVDHVLSKDGKQCLKIRNSVGEPCQEDSQCQLGIKDSECGPDGKCSCIENFHQRGSICFRDMSEYHWDRPTLDKINSKKKKKKNSTDVELLF